MNKIIENLKLQLNAQFDLFNPPCLTKRCVKKQEPVQTGKRPNDPAFYTETVGKEKLLNDQNVPWVESGASAACGVWTLDPGKWPIYPD